MPSQPSNNSSKRPKTEGDYQSSTLYFESKDPSHLEKWRLTMVTKSQQKYGKLSNIFISRVYPPPITLCGSLLPPAPETPWNDTNDPYSVKRECQKAAIQMKVKKESKIDDDKPLLYGFIKDHLSPPSLTQVKRFVVQKVADLSDTAHQDDVDKRSCPELARICVLIIDRGNHRTATNIWEEFECEGSPLALWEAILLTHQTCRLQSTRLDQDKAQQTYSVIRQYDTEDLERFKLRFDEAVKTLLVVGLPSPTTDQLVTRFIEGLNKDADQLRIDIKNAEYKGDPQHGLRL
jgi:hypothetical protein